jgi:Tfp pilus assembly protein PilO
LTTNQSNLTSDLSNLKSSFKSMERQLTFYKTVTKILLPIVAVSVGLTIASFYI